MNIFTVDLWENFFFDFFDPIKQTPALKKSENSSEFIHCSVFVWIHGTFHDRTCSANNSGKYRGIVRQRDLRKAIDVPCRLSHRCWKVLLSSTHTFVLWYYGVHHNRRGNWYNIYGLRSACMRLFCNFGVRIPSIRRNLFVGVV